MAVALDFESLEMGWACVVSCLVLTTNNQQQSPIRFLAIEKRINEQLLLKLPTLKHRKLIDGT